MRALNLADQRFGRLLVLRPDGHRGTDRIWLCSCDCGKTARVATASLRSGNSTSCGCLRIERITSHGLYKSPEHAIWTAAKQRCHNPKSQGFPDYGARGIQMCDTWRNDFEAFYRDMGPRPTARHTLDRRDNDGPYAPGNCRWVTQKVQAVNKRTNARLTWRGENLTMSQWAERLGTTAKAIAHRLQVGWSIDRALTAVSDRTHNNPQTKPLTFAGRTQTIREWAHELGITYSSLRERLERMPLERAMTMPSHQHSNGYIFRRQGTPVA